MSGVLKVVRRARIILPVYRGPMDIKGAQYIGRRRIAASPITPILIRKVRNKFLLHLAVTDWSKMGSIWSDMFQPRRKTQLPSVSLAKPGADLIRMVSVFPHNVHNFLLKIGILNAEMVEIFFDVSGGWIWII